jgi:hypothetical protein
MADVSSPLPGLSPDERAAEAHVDRLVSLGLKLSAKRRPQLVRETAQLISAARRLGEREGERRGRSRAIAILKEERAATGTAELYAPVRGVLVRSEDRIREGE